MLTLNSTYSGVLSQFSIYNTDTFAPVFSHLLNLLFQTLYGRTKKEVSDSHHQALHIGFQEATIYKFYSNVVGFTSKVLEKNG